MMHETNFVHHHHYFLNVIIIFFIQSAVIQSYLWLVGYGLIGGIYSIQLNNLSKNHSIIAFGDSLTHGLYVGNNDPFRASIIGMGTGSIMGYHSYVINLRKLINNRSISVLEHGRNTDDTHSMIPRLHKILSSSSSNQSLPLFVIILAGLGIPIYYYHNHHHHHHLQYFPHHMITIIIIVITIIYHHHHGHFHHHYQDHHLYHSHHHYQHHHRHCHHQHRHRHQHHHRHLSVGRS